MRTLMRPGLLGFEKNMAVGGEDTEGVFDTQYADYPCLFPQPKDRQYWGVLGGGKHGEGQPRALCHEAESKL